MKKRMWKFIYKIILNVLHLADSRFDDALFLNVNSEAIFGVGNVVLWFDSPVVTDIEGGNG